MFRLGFLSFLVGFVLVGAACTSRPSTPVGQSPVPSASSQSAITSPDESKANEEAPLSSGTDVDSLQRDLDNTDLSTINSAGTQIQTELSQ